MKNISVFYDGYYLQRVIAHYHEVRGQVLDLSALHRFIGGKAGGRVTSAHAYYGRSAPEQMDEQLLHQDRFFDILLARAGILAHILPVNGIGAEKGVDVWLALDIFEHASDGLCDVIALVAGDADYVPLLRKLKNTTTQSMSLGWNIPQTEDRRGIGASQALMAEADQSIAMEAVLDHPRESEGLLARSAVWAGNTGVIARVSEGYGFITPRRGGPALFFHRSALKNRCFDDLCVGDPVEFEIGRNHHGECAMQIRVV